MKHKISSLWQSWEFFWLKPVNANAFALYHKAFVGIVFVFYSVRFWNLEFYDEQSLVPRKLALGLFDHSQKPIWSFNFWPDSWALIMQTLFLSLLLLVFFGFARRPVLLLAWIIHVGFLQRNWAAGMGVDTMVTVFLFYLSFCDLGLKNQGDMLTRVMLRMSQVHLSVIYFYTGIEKLRGASWWDGTALWTAISNPQMTSLDLTWAHQFPGIIGLFSHLTVIFELMFLPLVWIPQTRLGILAIGGAFHLGVAGLMDLWAFSSVMVCQYLLWPGVGDKLSHFVNKIRLKSNH